MRPQMFLFGVIVIIIGVLLWLDNLGTLNLDMSWERDWPLILVFFGIMGISDVITKTAKRKKPRSFAYSLIFIIIGLWIWLSRLSESFDSIPDLSFQKNWPVLLIILGLYVAFCVAWRKNKEKRPRHHAKVHVGTNEGDTESSLGEKTTAQARTLKIRIWEKGSEDPKVKVNIPVGLVKWAISMVPESAREKMREKNIDPDIISDALAKNLSGTIVNIDEGPDGDRIIITLE